MEWVAAIALIRKNRHSHYVNDRCIVEQHNETSRRELKPRERLGRMNRSAGTAGSRPEEKVCGLVKQIFVDSQENGKYP